MMASNKQGGGKQQAAAASPGPDQKDEELDPKFEWLDNANNFLLRLYLTGFKKEDFRVQVDGTGKLTVRGQRPAAGSKHNTRFHKVFQLPSNANIDDITGRFEASVLTITVPKRPAPTSSAPAPTSVQEIKQKAPTAKQEPQPQFDEAPNKKKQQQEEEEEAAKKKQQQLQEEEEATKKKQQEEEEEAAAKKTKKLQEEEAIAKHKPATTTERKQAEPTTAAPLPGHVVDRESLAEKVKRRAEEECAKAAAAAEEKTATALSRWRERVAGELEHLGDMRWAEGVVETARRNKDVIATAVAAFSLGFFVSHKFFCRR